MTTPPTNQPVVPNDVPPRWANAWMKWALTAPGIQRLIGQGVALLSFEGRRTGRRYEIPISYHRREDTVTLITKRQRRWWHNFETPAVVGLRLAGRDYTGKAEIHADDAANLTFMMEYLAKRPIDAKAFGLAKDEITRERIEQILPHLVIIRITLDG